MRDLKEVLEQNKEKYIEELKNLVGIDTHDLGHGIDGGLEKQGQEYMVNLFESMGARSPSMPLSTRISRSRTPFPLRIPEYHPNAFIEADYYDFIPLIQLCVCYDRMGNYDKALYYHKETKKIRPDSPAVLTNEKYFQTISSNHKTN